MMTAQLGMIPSWMHSADPGVNIKLNPHVVYPDGWTQGTIQPVGQYYTAARIAQPNLSGLAADGCCPKCTCGGDNPCCITEGMRVPLMMRLKHTLAVRRNTTMMRGLGMPMPRMLGMPNARMLGMPIARTLGFFDSWAYENRKWLVIGGLGLIAAAGVGITTAVLR